MTGAGGDIENSAGLKQVSDLLQAAQKKPEARRAKFEEQVCHCPLLSRSQFRSDTENWSYKDARLNIMSAEEVAQWTEAPEKKKKSLDRRGSCFEPSRRLAPFPADFDLSFQTG